MPTDDLLTSDIGRDWIAEVRRRFDAYREEKDEDVKQRMMMSLGRAVSRRMIPVLKYLWRPTSGEDWQSLHAVVHYCCLLDPLNRSLTIDFPRVRYEWITKFQEGRQHKGASAYDVARNTFVLTGNADRARRWARIAVIEDVFTHRDIYAHPILAAWFLRTFLREPESEISRLVKFVCTLASREGWIGRDHPVPKGILWYPEQILAQYLAQNRPIRTTECELFEPCIASLGQLTGLLKSAKTPKRKGRALEGPRAELVRLG